MADRPTRIGGLGIGLDQVGGQITDLARKLAEIDAKLASDQFLGTDLPQIDQSVAPLFETINGQVFVYLAYFLPGYAAALKTVMVRDDQIVDNPSYKTKRLKDTVDLTNEDRTAFPASVQKLFGDPVKPGKLYHVILLAAFDDKGTPHFNPEEDPKFAAYPANVLFSFTAGAQVSEANAPSKPTAARIVANLVDPDSDGSLSIVTLRIFADETQALTFAAQNTVAVQPKLLDDGGAKAPSPPAQIETPTDTFVDVSVGGLITGQGYTWPKNTAFDSSGFGAVALATSTISFIAGGFSDPSDGLANLTFVSAAIDATEDPAQVRVTFVLNQPNPAYKLKNYTAKRKVSTRPDSDYDLVKNLVIDRENLRDPAFSTPGNITISFLMNVAAGKTYLVKITVRAIQSFTKDFTSGGLATAALALPAALTAAQGGPSYVNGGGMRASLKDYDDTFVAGGGAAGDAKYLGERWETFANSGVRIDNLASGGGGSLDADGVQWVSTEARLLIDTTVVTRGGKPAVILGKILAASQDWSGNILLRAKVADVTADLTMVFVNGGGDVVTATKTGFVIPVAEYKAFFFILPVPSTFTRNGKEWLELRFAANPSNQVVTTQWQLEPGIAFHFWKMNQREVVVSPTTNPTDNGEGLVTQLPVVITDDGTGEFSRTGIRAGEISLN